MMKPKTSEKPPAWQQNLVLIAKNTCVWLDQLSNKYHKKIQHLDDIPDEELDWLRSFGISGLWLIGIWKRSPASQRIKELYGHGHLIASAYSVLDYTVADQLGGSDALEKLKERAKQKGIRLACDMVPNHTGIDADWVTEHPDWYIASKNKPFESWSYTSADLSRDPNAIIRIEDGYYTQTGAAETFLVDFPNSGKKYYLYHGNDGTSMPWNDTAQLNYLKEEVRTAVKEKILHVTQNFEIIRLDAAMTLIRKHFKRLWFPDAGGEKFIPTRDFDNMTQEEFDQKMPNEFWREVLEDLEGKAPDTLMLAEAFWLMEKYFIEELGMHRVYNSAFMNQLRDEQNMRFFQYLEEIMQSDPTILEKFVNYLTTPDETPSVEQFGKSDKYFSICGLMAALPGLPMFGHGQIEGYAEKYGMDFKNAFRQEEPDQAFMDKHFKLITPLLKARERFSQAKNLRLFEFLSNESAVDRNVFVFSNHFAETRTLIIFNNQNKPSSGFFAQSIHQILNIENGEKGRVNLMEALGIPAAVESLALREIRSGSQLHIQTRELIDGFHFTLHPYELRVYDVLI